MRSITLAVLFLPALAVGRLFEDDAYLPDSAGSSSIASASPVSVPTSRSPVATSVSVEGRLELRQAPDPAAPAVNPAVPAAVNPAPAPAPVTPQNPGLAPVNNPVPPAAPAPAPNAPAVAPPANPIAPAANPVNPAAPALTTTSTLPAPPATNNQDFISVQWIESWSGTVQTWVPKTITFHFEPVMSQAPLPGKGEIGMGTLTGIPGKTKTIVVGAAPTHVAGWMRGVAAAVGVGVVGIML